MALWECCEKSGPGPVLSANLGDGGEAELKKPQPGWLGLVVDRESLVSILSFCGEHKKLGLLDHHRGEGKWRVREQH